MQDMGQLKKKLLETFEITLFNQKTKNKLGCAEPHSNFTFKFQTQTDSTQIGGDGFRIR